MSSGELEYQGKHSSRLVTFEELNELSQVWRLVSSNPRLMRNKRLRAYVRRYFLLREKLKPVPHPMSRRMFNLFTVRSNSSHFACLRYRYVILLCGSVLIQRTFSLSPTHSSLQLFGAMMAT